MKLGILVPCYNEEGNVEKFFEVVTEKIRECDWIRQYTILFINDGSSDNTLKKIKNMAEEREGVSYLSFARNFGKEAAMLAGFSKLVELEFDYIGIMDADLQDPPDLLPAMIEKLENNKELDCVVARRVNRAGEGRIRSFFSNLFYSVFNLFSDINIKPGTRDFRVMKLDVAKALVEMGERNRFSKGLFAWVGYNTEWVEYENIIREQGSSKWSFLKLCSYAIDGIISFSTIPLTVVSALGGFICLASFVGFLVIFIQKLVGGLDIEGYALLTCSVFLLSGVQLLSLGIIGRYISKIYTETKGRPVYFIREQYNSIQTQDE